MENHYRSHFFAAEAALVGKLQHPNVVQILDAVADAESPYLVMELVEGASLKALLDLLEDVPLSQALFENSTVELDCLVDTLENLQANERSGFYQSQVAKFRERIVGHPRREIFRVAVSKGVRGGIELLEEAP